MSWPSEKRWSELWSAIGASGDPLAWYARLSTAYSENHRHYHNQQHIAECLAQFDTARHLARNPQAVELALWFHDAVYDPKANDNEEQSADLARRCLTEATVPPNLVEMVCRLILATKTHNAGEDTDTALMIDVDLSILGQDEERFLQYETQIRHEYDWVPAPNFASKRTEILEHFLVRKTIFKTKFFHDRYEVAAQSNLISSIQILKAINS